MGLFLECELIFQGFLAFKPDEFRQNSKRERRGCKSSLTEGDANPSTLHHLCHEEADLHGLSDQVGDQGEEAPCQIKYQTKLKILKIVKKCLNNFRLFAEILPKICSKNCKILLKIILIGGMEDNSKVQQVQQVLSLTNLETAKNQNRSKKLEIRKICFKILLFLDT